MSPHPLRNRSRDLRKNATKQEKQLWYKYLNTFPLRVHRQVVIGSYIVDFYCHQAKIVIELDGGQHFEGQNINRDEIRTRFLESQGLLVIRFTNREVDQQFAQVCQHIKDVVDRRSVELAETDD